MTDPKDRGPDPTPAVAAGATYDAFLSHTVPRSIATLPRSASNFLFGDGDRQLVVVDRANATAHLLDIAWLKDIADPNRDTLTNDDLIGFVCKGPAGTLVNHDALQVAMREATPKGLSLSISNELGRAGGADGW